MPSTLSVPFSFTVDVHEVEGVGFYGEVRELPACLAQADTIEGLAEAIKEAVRDDFAEPGVQTEETARRLGAIQGAVAIPEGPYPLRRDDRPPALWTEAHEDE